VREEKLDIFDETGSHIGVEARSEVHKIGMIKDITSAPGIVDKELCHVFACECEQPLHLYRLQQEEVTGLFWVGLDEVERLFAGEVLTAVASGFWIQEDGSSHEESLEVAKAVFVLHEEHYYRQVFAAIKTAHFRHEWHINGKNASPVLDRSRVFFCPWEYELA
jgi:hypothetical protein